MVLFYKSVNIIIERTIDEKKQNIVLKVTRCFYNGNKKKKITFHYYEKTALKQLVINDRRFAAGIYLFKVRENFFEMTLKILKKSAVKKIFSDWS